MQGLFRGTLTKPRSTQTKARRPKLKEAFLENHCLVQSDPVLYNINSLLDQDDARLCRTMNVNGAETKRG